MNYNASAFIYSTLIVLNCGMVQAAHFSDEKKFYDTVNVQRPVKALGMTFEHTSQIMSGDIPEMTSLANVTMSSPEPVRMAVRWAPDFDGQNVVRFAQAEVYGKNRENKFDMILDTSMELIKADNKFYFVSKSDTTLQKIYVKSPPYQLKVSADAYQYSLEAAVYNP